MNELTLDGKVYVSSKRAAEITGYAKDYIGQLCREGRVEARLVGRNWYILETSIRAHRFGKEAEIPAPVEQNAAVSSWDKPRYAAEEPSPIPKLSIREVIEEDKPQRGAILSDMQSAWQEWFTRKAEPIEESVPAESIEEPEPRVEVEEEAEERIAIQTIIEEDSEPEESIEEVVAVPEPQNTLDLTKPEEVNGEDEYADEEAPIEEEWTYTVKMGGSRGTNAVIRIVFILIAVIAVVVALVGTGLAQRYSNLGIYRLTEIDILSGTTHINK